MLIHCGPAPATPGTFAGVVELAGGERNLFPAAIIAMEAAAAEASYTGVYSCQFVLRDGQYFCIGDAYTA
jgi:hypothetical protein